MISRGDVYDADIPLSGVRPAVVVTRSEAVPVLSGVAVVAVTSTVRGHVAEVPLNEEEGLDHPCVANCDDLATVPKTRLLRYRGHLGPTRLRELDDALRVALGLD